MGNREFRKRKCFGLILATLIGIICSSAPFQTYASLPDEIRLFPGQARDIDFSIPISAEVTLDHPDVIHLNGEAKQSLSMKLNHPISLSSHKTGNAEMSVKLFGAIPYKKVKLNVIPDLKVIPGGQTIGVKIRSAGIMVVGHHLVRTEDDRKFSPGKQADIQTGDLIMEMNGQRINDVKKVSELVEKAGKSGEPIRLKIKRKEKLFEVDLTPAYDVEDRAYRMGLYIRDSAAGVGTLTFYAPDQGVYGALGHVITDMDTQMPIEVGSGEIIHSTVTSISKSQNGSPGEKRAHFFREDKVLGNIEKNTRFGIFGKMKDFPEYGMIREPIPVAFAEEVHPGPAKIMTVVEGNRVESYDIEIVYAAKQETPATKGMIIRIVDPRLLEKTGGIVQGMSGSPIIQDGKLVGAVTHVFVNDPTSGYGCFIEWMLQDAGILLTSSDFHSSRRPKAG